jgi:hypothetical protein
MLVSYLMTNEAETVAKAPTRLIVKRAGDAKGILKAELKRRDMTYADLVERLGEHGVAETEANLRNKISRGAFTAAFFVQCLIAIGCDYVQIKAAPTRPPEGG